MAVVTVRRPDLTAEEVAKRMEEIKRATIHLVIETEKAKQERTQDNEPREQKAPRGHRPDGGSYGDRRVAAYYRSY